MVITTKTNLFFAKITQVTIGSFVQKPILD